MPDDQLPEPTELDEIASAGLDDEATDAERARIDAEPELADRVEELRVISDQVASVVPLTDERRDSLIAAALSATATVEAPESAPAETKTPAAPASLARHRSRRPRSQAATFAAVAAIVIAILAIPALLIGLNRDSSVHDTASSSTDAEASYDSQGLTLSGAPTSTELDPPDQFSTAGSSGQPVAFGDVASATDLQTTVQSELAKRAPDSEQTDDSGPVSTTSTIAAPSSTTASVPPLSPEPFTGACEDEIRQQLPGAGTLVLGGTVDYQGSPRHVYAFQTEADGPVTIVVADPDTCEIVTRTVLPHR